jgi:hypothetical protein
MQVSLSLSKNVDLVDKYTDFGEDNDEDNDEDNIKEPIPPNKIKKNLPKPPPEEKEDLGKCACGERQEEMLQSAKSFLDKREVDGQLRLSKEDADSLLKLLDKAVSIFKLIKLIKDFHL